MNLKVSNELENLENLLLEEDMQIDNLCSQATQSFQSLLEEAFNAGRNYERLEIRKQFENLFPSPLPRHPQVSTPFTDKLESNIRDAPYIRGSATKTTPVSAPTVSTRSKNGDTYLRKPAGTVKPTIQQLLLDNPKGITIDAIIHKTGFKKTSVSATLYTLQSFGLAKYHKQLWFNKK